GLAKGVRLPERGGHRFTPLIRAKLDPRRHTLVYTSAGHQTGYVLNSAGAVKQALASTGYPLGILKEADFPASEEIPLQPGDLVMLVTDGIVEARAPDGTVFGWQRTVDSVRVYRQQTAGEIEDDLYY